MSPLMALITMGVLLGTLAFLVALIARKRGCAMKLLVFPVMILLWLLMASIPPNAEAECERLFGHQVRQSAKHIQSWKPLGMDGFLLSFQISRPEFQHLIAPSFTMQLLGGIRFLDGDSRPDGWPTALESLSECLRREVGEDKLLLYYDDSTETVYASFQYWGW
jgi:hypothetical protein